MRIEHYREQMARDADAREEHREKMRRLAENGGPFVDEDGNPIRRNARYSSKK